MAQPASDQQNSQPSVVDALHDEHDRSIRFRENNTMRPRNGDPNASFETKWAFQTAEAKSADVNKKVSHHLGSAQMSMTFAAREIREEITELDSLIRGINVREQELESMTDSLNLMCLRLAARADRRKQREAASSTTAISGTVLGGRAMQQSRLLQEYEDIALQTAKDETTISAAVSTADEISMAERSAALRQMSSDLSSLNTTSATTADEIPARSPSHFDYSVLSVYTPLQRSPCKMDSTITCPSTPKSSSSSRYGSERRE